MQDLQFLGQRRQLLNDLGDVLHEVDDVVEILVLHILDARSKLIKTWTRAIRSSSAIVSFDKEGSITSESMRFATEYVFTVFFLRSLIHRSQVVCFLLDFHLGVESLFVADIADSTIYVFQSSRGIDGSNLSQTFEDDGLAQKFVIRHDCWKVFSGEFVCLVKFQNRTLSSNARLRVWHS